MPYAIFCQVLSNMFEFPPKFICLLSFGGGIFSLDLIVHLQLPFTIRNRLSIFLLDCPCTVKARFFSQIWNYLFQVLTFNEMIFYLMIKLNSLHLSNEKYFSSESPICLKKSTSVTDLELITN